MEETLTLLETIRWYIEQSQKAIEHARHTGVIDECDTLEQYIEGQVAEAIDAVVRLGWSAEKAFKNA
jgi:hypothetical protein